MATEREPDKCANLSISGSRQKIKLSVFPNNHFGVGFEEDVFLHRDDFPDFQVGDVVEIYQAGTDMQAYTPRLLLMIGPKSIYPDNQLPKPLNKESIYIEKSIAETFHLQKFANVYVNKVDPFHVALDTLELTFKDQYMGRSEMWRLKNNLVGTCVFSNKKLEMNQGSIRCQVYEMWSRGDRVACGVVTDDTKIVFRSSTAMIYLFIQMSSEMWDFDNFCDLYFEKAVNGFLAEMFEKWSRFGSSHEVTIVLFSRCFYESKEWGKFPEKMRECLQVGYNGKYYEDFYRVVVQNERFDNWKPVLLELRQIFADYQNSVLNYHKTGNPENDKFIPEAVLSNAAQGNFLEVLNMSLNTFENHYLNRNLDRTGQQCIVITPGVGLFEVDRELMQITKQRIIDSGVGSDLICVGEQPLHAVPLFKLYNKETDGSANNVDDYSMPHWINLSFYNKIRYLGGCSLPYVPRVRLPSEVEPVVPHYEILTHQFHPRGSQTPGLEVTNDPYADFDDFDTSVFAMPDNRRLNRCNSVAGIARSVNRNHSSIAAQSNGNAMRKFSDPEVRSSRDESSRGIPKNLSFVAFDDGFFPSSAGSHATPQHGASAQGQDCEGRDFDAFGVGLIGSIDNNFDHEAIKKYLLRPGRTFINPFDPSHTEIRITSNRRRWTHIFPMVSKHNYEVRVSSDEESGSHQRAAQAGREQELRVAADTVEVAPTLNAGVDWKSLTIPATLPITTDFFPDQKTLVNEFLVNEYDLTPEEIWLDSQRSPLGRTPLTNEEVFQELISQRLGQGFQLITGLDESRPFPKKLSAASMRPRLLNRTRSVWLSIGCIFHKVSLSEDKKQIKVTCYRLRNPYPSVAVHYRYRFAAPDNNDYEVSWVEFQTEQLEHFNWNRMDFYVCTRGDKEFVLTESLKYWRFRLYAVPMTQFLPFTKKIMENGASQPGDIYTVRLSDEPAEQIEKFLRFVETCLNRLKRPQAPNTRRSNANQTSPSERPRAYTSGSHLQKFRNDLTVPSSSLGGPSGPLSPPPREISLSTSNMSNEGGSSYDSPSNLSVHESLGEIAADRRPSLSLTSTLTEIVDAMKLSKSDGITFFNRVPGFPPLTFIAYEAVKWMLENVEDVCSCEKAIKILQNMIEKKLICHASGNASIPFTHGHHFYSIVQRPIKPDWPLYSGDSESFQNDWIEIDIDLNYDGLKSRNLPASVLPQVPDFLDQSLDEYPDRGTVSHQPFFKFVTIDVDQFTRSERKEWGHLKYQPRYNPKSAFELTLQWSVATGSIITDLIHGWARKSQQSGFSLIPIPHDPFALPITKNSDPVRGPIFVELNTECLVENRSFLFEQFPQSTWEKRMLLFRQEIAYRFGFVSCVTDSSRRSFSSLFSTDHQYIHCTGNMFLLIPTQVQLQTGIQGLKIKSSTTGAGLMVSRGSNLETPVQGQRKQSKLNRHLTEAKPVYDHSETGFLWSWNFMISKRWKQISNTGATGDIAFMDKMLADFRAFCRNDDNRLKNFWDECWQKKLDQDSHTKATDESKPE